MDEDWDNDEYTPQTNEIKNIEYNIPSYTETNTQKYEKVSRYQEKRTFDTRNLNKSTFDTQEELDGESKSELEIPSKHVGLLIGKGGANIKKIRQRSGARIHICENVSNSPNTVVCIYGDRFAVGEAKRSIEQQIGEFNKKDQPKSSSRYTQSNQSDKSTIDWSGFLNESKKCEQDWLASLAKINKEFYVEPIHIANLTDEEVKKMRKENNDITVSKENESFPDVIPKPIIDFSDAFSNYDEIMESVKKCGFKKPSPIQCQSWPVLLSGYDLIGIAQTGTGKTLAFLLPALIHIDMQPIPRNKRFGPTCLILSPTRELAQQIHKEVLKFNYKGIRSVCVYGGGNRTEQIDTVLNGVEIIIATPGRLNDLIENRYISLDSVTFLVLDEADRMLDLGFEPEIRKILIDIRPDRQTVMTSATWPFSVSNLANTYMNNPIRINVGSLDLAACHSVTQRIMFVEEDEKFNLLECFLKETNKDEKILIFVGRKITADRLATDLGLRNVITDGIQCIHGDREQSDRETALEDFKTGVARILIATDVASRGLDICDITYVLNYDFPKNIEEYVHRIGRTGRAGRSGCSISYMTRDNWAISRQLINILKEAEQTVPQELVLMAERFASKQRDILANKFEPSSRVFSARKSNSCYKCGKTGHILL